MLTRPISVTIRKDWLTDPAEEMKAFSNKKIKKYYLLIILFVSFVDVAYTTKCFGSVER